MEGGTKKKKKGGGEGSPPAQVQGNRWNPGVRTA